MLKQKNYSFSDVNGDYITFPFYKDNRILEYAPICGMSLKKAGSMRFRWNEVNQNRIDFLKSVAQKKSVVSVELIHSKNVINLVTGKEADLQQADGFITKNPDLMPVITVADCMPLYLYDSVTKVFGVVHSGWKGTGIIAEAIKLAEKCYGSKPEDFSVVIGPHIHDCCYIVNQERADFFRENFCDDCVSELEAGGKCYCGGRGLAVSWNNGTGRLYRLSLEKANLAVLLKAGVKNENISIIDECTCCNTIFGSNRRETADFSVQNIKLKEDAPEQYSEALQKAFTVQAAFVFYCK